MFKLEYENDQGEEDEPYYYNKDNWRIANLHTTSTYRKGSVLNNTSKYHKGTFEFQLDLNKDRKRNSDSDSATGGSGNTTNNCGPFICHYCDAKFRIRGYLTRHIKKHAIEKAYRCPFYKEDAPKELRCHNSGGFSRRDTYKTHLKTRHLLYPNGVKPSERNRSYGHCAQCGAYCASTKNWVESHIESGQCKGLPQNYLRVIRHERSKNGKLKMIRTSNGHSRFITTAQSVVDPNILSNREALEAMAIVAHKANKDNILSKYGNDKIIMDVKDFSSDSEDEHMTFSQVETTKCTDNINTNDRIASNNKSDNNNNKLSDSFFPTFMSDKESALNNKFNPIDKLLEPFDEIHKQIPLDMSIFEFDHFTNATKTKATTTTTTNTHANTDNYDIPAYLISKLPSGSQSSQSSTPSPMTILQQDLLLDGITDRDNSNDIEDIYSLLPN